MLTRSSKQRSINAGDYSGFAFSDRDFLCCVAGRRTIRGGHSRGSNISDETRSRTRVSRELDGYCWRRFSAWEQTRSETLKLLWFQMTGFEAHSSLPHDQNDGGRFFWPRSAAPFPAASS